MRRSTCPELTARTRSWRGAWAALAACLLAALACSPAAGLAGPATATRVATATTGQAVPSATAGRAAATATTAAPAATAGAATPTSAETASVATASAAPTGQAGGVVWVPGSSQKVCQLVGETDKQFNTPTLNQTGTRWGLAGNDLGFSFEHDGKLFFLFGDSGPTRTFNGQPNGPTSANRLADDNDAIAYTSDSSVTPCPHLTFIHYANGAFKNPVVLNAQGQPAITLRTNEVPLGGISDGGRMYVFFATDNPIYQAGGPSKGNLGTSTRSVVGVSDDDGEIFHYLYDFSKGPDAKFIEVAPAAGSDGYNYFWGSQGGDLYRKSAPYLARQRQGMLGTPDGLEYFHGLNADGSPSFMPGESNAVAVFHDSPDCVGEMSISWNPFVKRWLFLYNCADNAAAHPRGVYLRSAAQPWGPWSEPQTIFNEQRDGGLCNFIHRAVNGQLAQCDNLAEPNQLADFGGGYGPYVLGRYTTGDAAQGTSTIYYTLSTWIPYTEVILQSSLRLAP